MYRKEYTKELGWKTFYYDKKEQYYGDFDMACEKFKYTVRSMDHKIVTFLGTEINFRFVDSKSS